MEIYQIMGLIICTGVLLGIIVPIVATSLYPRKENVVPTIISSLLENIGTLGSRELVIEKNFTVKPEMYLNISIAGGGVDVSTWRQRYVLVKVYKPSILWGLSTERGYSGNYTIEYDDSKNVLYISLIGYSAEIYLPENLGAIHIDCSGGAVDLSVSSSTLNTINIIVSGGAVNAELEGLKNTNVSFRVSGGVIDSSLKYIEYNGLSKALFKISGGVLNTEIKLPITTKVKILGRYTGGITNTSIDDERVGKTYIDEYYDESQSKFYLEYTVSGGIANIGIER